MNTCPTGFFCLDNNILIIVIIAIVYFIVSISNKKQDFIKHEAPIPPANKTDIVINNPIVDQPIEYQRLSNPLLPPVRSYPYVNSIPINVATRGYVSNYSQIGALISNDIKHGNTASRIMPLYGKQVYPSSSKWMYYTVMDKYNMVKLPVTYKNRQCTDDLGCDELYEGDKVTVIGNSGDFTVTIYNMDYPKYIP